jgi:hypothetical protein
VKHTLTLLTAPLLAPLAALQATAAFAPQITMNHRTEEI